MGGIALHRLDQVGDQVLPLLQLHVDVGEGLVGPLPAGVLLLACEKLGVLTTLSELTRAAGTNAQGTKMAGLKRAAESVKLKAEGLQASREALADVPLPAVGFWQGSHYITVLEWRGRGESGTALIQDPNEDKARLISDEKLVQSTSGYFLSLRR